LEGSHLKKQWEVSIKMNVVEVGYDDVKLIEVALIVSHCSGGSLLADSFSIIQTIKEVSAVGKIL
jgi:hypothetical protein